MHKVLFGFQKRETVSRGKQVYQAHKINGESGTQVLVFQFSDTFENSIFKLKIAFKKINKNNFSSISLDEDCVSISEI